MWKCGNLRFPDSPISKFPLFQISKSLRRLLDEIVDQLRRGVVHFDVEVLDPAGEVVVEPYGGGSGDEPESPLREGFRDTGGHRGSAAPSRGGHGPGRRRDSA